MDRREQLELAQYVSRTLSKLASSTLGVPTMPVISPPTGIMPPSTLPSPLRASVGCKDIADYGYVIFLQGHLYKIRQVIPPGASKTFFFYNEQNTQVTDPTLLQQLASAVWTRENIVASADVRGNGSTQVSNALQTSKAMLTYTTMQDLLARAMVEATLAGVSGGVSLTKAAGNITVGFVKGQLVNTPTTLLALAAQRGLERSLDAYRQLEAVPLPARDATALNAGDLSRINELYTQARSLQLAYGALAAQLLPKSLGDLMKQAMASAAGEAIGPLFSGNESDAVTLQELLALQKGIGNVGKALPALQAYSQNVNLAINDAAANIATISKWAAAAGQKCE